MCQRCDGFSEEEVERGYDLTIKVDGYVRIQVESVGQPAWAYTMGLNEQFGHPDLICVEVSADLQRQLSFTVGQMIVDDGHPDPEALAEMDVELVPADPVHLSGNRIALWANCYDRLPLVGEFLQVLPGPSGFCSCHTPLLQRMNEPAPIMLRLQNRQQRRTGRNRKLA